MLMSKVTCKYCGGIGHTQAFCFRKPRKHMIKKIPLRKVGKLGKQWQVTRATWFRKHALRAGEEYHCYICERPIGDHPQLDHIQSRVRHPELRFNLDNLAPICEYDNRMKSSLSLEEYLHRKSLTTQP